MLWRMVSTYTPLGINKQGTGDNTNTWGVVLNEEALDLFDEAIRGMASFTVTGAVILTATNGESNQARCAILNITGGTGGTVQIPAISKAYFVFNGASGDVVITTGGATTATIPSGAALPAVCDGSAVKTLRLANLPLKEYIDAAILAGTVTDLPATTGNEGKALVVQSGSWIPKTLTSADISDFNAKAIAFAVAL